MTVGPPLSPVSACEAPVAGGTPAPCPHEPPALAGRRFPRVFGATARKGVLSLADQAVVSGASFLTTVAVGRWCGPDELGVYALGASLVVVALTVLQSLIVVPYTVYGNRLAGADRTEYAGAVLVHCGLLAAAASLGLAVWAGGLWLGEESPRLAMVLATLALTAPFLLLREFGRRLTLAHMNARTALAIDVSAAALQTGGLAALAAAGLLSAVTASGAIGLAAAVAGGVWLLLARKDFTVRRERVVPELRRNGAFGGWVLAGQLVSHLNSDIFVLWLLAFVLGKAAAGVFAAAMTIVLFANPFILGVGQVLTPRVAQAFHDGGPAEVRRVAAKATLFLGAVMAAFCTAVLFFGGDALRLLYGGKYAGNEWTVVVLAGVVFTQALSMAAGSGLWALERPDVNLRANVAGLAVTAAVAGAMVGPWGVLGVAWGLLAGQVAASATRCFVFLRLTAGARAEEAAA